MADSMVGLLALYFLIWWIMLFAVLPFGVRGQHEDEVAPGTEPGAPQTPRLAQKAVLTTLLSAVVLGAVVLFAELFDF